MQGSRLQTYQRRVIIIGGGASGVLLAYHLLRDKPCDLQVTLIEKRPEVGRGIAYLTANPDHLLNVRDELVGLATRIERSLRTRTQESVNEKHDIERQPRFGKLR